MNVPLFKMNLSKNINNNLILNMRSTRAIGFLSSRRGVIIVVSSQERIGIKHIQPGGARL